MNASLDTLNRYIAGTVISNENDIAYYIGKKCTEQQKYQMINNRRLPDEKFKFPPNTDQRNLKFQRSWLIEHPWLVYSASLNGGFCQYCCFFAPKEAGHTELRTFVTEPFTRFIKAREILRNHDNNQYHKRATIDALNFLDVFSKKNCRYKSSTGYGQTKGNQIKSNDFVFNG